MIDSFRPLCASDRPIFRWDRAGDSLFYAPNRLCVVRPADADWFEERIIQRSWDSHSTNDLDQAAFWAAELWRAAGSAIEERRREQEVPFSPECLTLYLNNECSLNCIYCFADPSPGSQLKLGLEVVTAAAELVAANCLEKELSFTTVFHGGGEPTLHPERVDEMLSVLDWVAASHKVERFGYIATNGMLSEQDARWLARSFDLVGLSCDGPADIQNAQRPLWGSGPSALHVERTARILQAEGRRLHIRATITAATVRRQVEIVDSFWEKFAPEEIHFEPVYAGGRAVGSEEMEPEDFVTHFLAAREKARLHGVPLIYAGCRLGQIHGPYCNLFRQVVNLVPGDVATACFKLTNGDQVRAGGTLIGALNPESGRFEIDHDQVRELRLELASLPAHCQACFNQFHCARECPETCVLGKDSSLNSFRCQVQRSLAATNLAQAADELWAATKRLPADGLTREVYGRAL